MADFITRMAGKAALALLTFTGRRVVKRGEPLSWLNIVSQPTPAPAPEPIRLGDGAVCPHALLNLAIVLADRWWPDNAFDSVEDIALIDTALERVFPWMAEEARACLCAYGERPGSDASASRADCPCDGAALIRGERLNAALASIVHAEGRPGLLPVPPVSIDEARLRVVQARIWLSQLEQRASKAGASAEAVA